MNMIFQPREVDIHAPENDIFLLPEKDYEIARMGMRYGYSLARQIARQIEIAEREEKDNGRRRY